MNKLIIAIIALLLVSSQAFRMRTEDLSQSDVQNQAQANHQALNDENPDLYSQIEEWAHSNGATDASTIRGSQHRR